MEFHAWAPLFIFPTIPTARVNNLHYEKFQDGTVKCIEDEIPFEVPEGWEWTRLGNLSSLIQYGLSNSAETQGTHRLLRITDIQDGKVNWKDVPFTTVENAENYLLRKDDIVFARTGATVGKSFLVTELPFESVYASYLIRIRLFDCISPIYLYQFFNSYCYWEQITDKSVGVGQPNCNGTSLKELFIPLPPLHEQKRIVPAANALLKYASVIESEKASLQEIIDLTKSKILDLAIRGKLVPQDPNDEPASVLLERIRSEKEELIKQGKIKCDKKESVIFKGDDNSYYLDIPNNWMVCYLKEIFNVCSAKRVKQSEWKTSGVPFYRAREIVKLSDNGYVDNDLFISEEHYMKLKAEFGVPKSGDLMVSGVGTIGRVYIVKENDLFYYKDASVLCFENRTGAIDSQFARYMFESKFMQSQMKENSNGTTVDTITISAAMDYVCVLPPIAEQKRIVTAIEKAVSQLDKISESIV